MEYNRLIDHTLLKADASSQAISNLCNEALQWKFFSVCVNPSYVNLAKQKLVKTGIKICSVIGFPLGQTSTKQKVYEAKQAIKSGANEIDMVINIPELKSKCACVVDEIRLIKRVCKKKYSQGYFRNCITYKWTNKKRNTSSNWSRCWLC